MISLFSRGTCVMIWLVIITVHAGKVKVSNLNHGKAEPLQFNSLSDGTHVEPGRILKKVKKSKAPKRITSNPPIVTSCSSCYTAADSEAFLRALANITNYVPMAGLVANICAGQTIPVSVYGGVLLSNPNSLPCKKYKLTINCCGGLSNCGLQYTGEYGYVQDSILYFFSDNPSYYGDYSNQVAIDLTLNGITFSTSATSDAVDYYLSLPTTLSNCTNTVGGSFKTVGNIGYTYSFTTQSIG
jgi:hypothetical protein